MTKRTTTIYITTALSTLLFSSFIVPSTEIGITGHLKSKSHKKVGGITVFATDIAKNGMGKTVTDKNGNFSLDFDIGSEMEPSIYYVARNNDTILLKHLGHMKDQTTEMTFWIK